MSDWTCNHRITQQERQGENLQLERQTTHRVDTCSKLGFKTEICHLWEYVSLPLDHLSFSFVNCIFLFIFLLIYSWLTASFKNDSKQMTQFWFSFGEHHKSAVHHESGHETNFCFAVLPFNCNYWRPENIWTAGRPVEETTINSCTTFSFWSFFIN